MSAKKVGLFGGNFDPVHNGHIEIALKSLEALGLDEIWFLPELNPRRKNSNADYKHRLEMLKIAANQNPQLIIDRLEIQKNGTNYTISTLKDIIQTHPNHDFWMIVGEDVMLHFHTWENYQEFLDLTSFAIVFRDGDFRTQSLKNIQNLKQKHANFKHQRIDLGKLDISSTAARELIKAQKYNQLPEGVDVYIVQNNLYI